MHEIRRKLATLLIVAMSININSFATGISNNDGSAFITKAEFDALKSSFQVQIDTYNQGIDSKIDAAIASYLAGIKVSTTYDRSLLCSNLDSVLCLDLGDPKYTYDYNQGVDIVANDYYLYWCLDNKVATPYRKMVKNTFNHTGDVLNKIYVKNLDKTNKTAVWAGYADDAKESWYFEAYSHQGTGTAKGIVGFTGVLLVGSQWYYTGTQKVNAPFTSDTLMLGYSAQDTEGAYWRNPLYYQGYTKTTGTLKDINAIIWKSKAEKTFSVYDEILGWGNTQAELGMSRVADFTDLYDTLAFDVRGNRYDVAAYTAVLATANTISIVGGAAKGNCFPGERLAGYTITNWNQLYNSDFGKLWGPSKNQYLKMFNSIPFLQVEPKEQVTYNITFEDDAKTYEVYMGLEPFKDDGYGNNKPLLISIDNTSWNTVATINGHATIYIDFVDKNTITGTSTIFLKWRESGNDNGGGEIVFTSKNATIKKES